MDNAGAGETSQSESVFPSSVMNINIRTLDSRIYPLTVHTRMMVSELKRDVAGATGVLVQHQRLLHGGQDLIDERPLSSYNIEDGHTVHLVTQHSRASSSGRLASQPVPAAVPSDTESSHNLEVADPNTPGLLPADGTANGRIVAQDAMTTMFQSVIRMRQLYVHNDVLPPVPLPVDPTLDALAVLVTAMEPLIDNTSEDLLLLSRALEHYSPSVDARTQHATQLEAQRLGAQLEDIGAFFLELGQVTANIRLDPDTGAVVRSGLPVYITHTGPITDLLQPRNARQPGTSSGVPSSSTVQTPISERHDPYQAGTSSGIPSSSSVPPHVSEGEDPDIGSSSRHGSDESMSPRGKRQREE